MLSLPVYLLLEIIIKLLLFLYIVNGWLIDLHNEVTAEFSFKMH